jgi:hypothetical protein
MNNIGEKTAKWVAFLANILTIINIVSTTNHLSLTSIYNSPYFVILVETLVTTVFIFVFFPCWKHFREHPNKTLETFIYSVMVIILILIAILLSRRIECPAQKAINIDSLKKTIPPLIIYKDSVVYVPKIVYIPKSDKVVKEKSPVSQKNNKGDNNAAGGDNNGNQGGVGNKSHSVSGNGNQVGVNGDVSVTNEKQLTEEERVNILAFIKKTMQEKNLKCIGFLVSQGSNGGKFLSQLKDALKKEGYDMNNGFNGSNATSSNGISFSSQMGCLTITVGTF